MTVWSRPVTDPLADLLPSNARERHGGASAMTFGELLRLALACERSDGARASATLCRGHGSCTPDEWPG